MFSKIKNFFSSKKSNSTSSNNNNQQQQQQQDNNDFDNEQQEQHFNSDASPINKLTKNNNKKTTTTNNNNKPTETKILIAYGGTRTNTAYSLKNPTIPTYEICEINYPFQKIKEIIAGGEYAFEYSLFWTIDENSKDKLYITNFENKSVNYLKFIKEKQFGDNYYTFYKINYKKLIDHFCNNSLQNNSFFSSIFNKNKENKEINNEINNKYKLKGVYGSGDVIILEFYNSMIYVLDGRSNGSDKVMSFYLPLLKKIIVGSVSRNTVFLSEDNTMFRLCTSNNGSIEKKDLQFKKNKLKNIKFIACANTCIVTITQNNNKLYGFGNNDYDVLNGEVCGDSFKRIKAPWDPIVKNGKASNKSDMSLLDRAIDKMDRAIDKNYGDRGVGVKALQCGYAHTVVLLENGSIYACGLNSLTQALQENPNGSGVTTCKEFIKFKYPIDFLNDDLLNNLVQNVHCISRGTVLETRKEFILIGEVAQQSKYCKSFGNILKCLIIEKKEGFCNAIACGPWHYLFFWREEKNTKSLNEFFKRLKEMARECGDYSTVVDNVDNNVDSNVEDNVDRASNNVVGVPLSDISIVIVERVL